jgi:AcrR family transcriptional regulator
VDPARARAEKRVQRFLDAALDLLTGAPGRDFTVQEVVKKSGQSLRSFYQYFGGKHELLLALLEDAVTETADRLREAIAEEPDAGARLRRFTLEYHRLCHPHLTGGADKEPRHTVLGMAEFAQQLLMEHPKETAQAFTPMLVILEDMLDRAAAEGVVRPGLDHRLVAGTMLQALLFHPFALTLGGITREAEERDAETLRDMLVRAVVLPGADTAS